MGEVRLIDANALNEHKFLSPQVKVIGGRHSGKLKEQITQAYQKGWNDCIDAIIDNATTVEINDKSLEIAQKSIKLGRRLGNLEGKIETEKPKGMMSEDDKKSLNALKEDFKERYKRAEEWIEKASDEEIRIRAEATRDFIAEVILTIDKYMRGDK